MFRHGRSAEVIDGVTDLYTARLTHLEKVIALLHPIPTDRRVWGASSPNRRFAAQTNSFSINETSIFRALGGVHGLDHRANPYARVWETSHARVDPSSLLEPITRMSPTPTVNVEFGVPSSSATNKRASYHPIATTVRLPGR